MSLSGNLGNAGDEARSLYEQLRGITSEIKGQATEVSKTRKAFREFEKGAQNLKFQYEGINSLSDDQVKKLNEQLNKQKAILDQEIKSYEINDEISSKITEIQEEIKKGSLTIAEGNDYLLSEIQLLQNITDEEKAILSAMHDEENVLGRIQNLSKEELKIRNEKNRLLGVGGNLLKGLNKIAGEFSSAFKLDEVQTEMENLASRIADPKIKESGNRLTVLGRGLKTAFRGLGDTLTDPSVIFAALIKGFTAVDKVATDFARQTGEDINTMSTSIDSLNMGYVNMADYIKAASELTKELGINAANVFNKEDILEVAQMTDEIGLAGKEAANLAKFSKLNNTSIENQNKSLIQSVNSYNRQNKTAVTGRKVLDDIANTSKSIAVSYTGYPEKLGKAATAAASLGMNLEQVDKIASSLLNFESSISAELEAELLTGKSLNLEKARELALSNDLEGVTNEIANQLGSAAEFGKMNRIEQEAMAKAVGMSRDELAGSLIAKTINSKLDEEALTSAQKQTYEAFKNREAQDKIAQSLAKIGQAFAPIVGFVADIVSNSYVLYSIMGLALLPKVLSLGSAFGGMFKSLSSIGGGGLGKSIGGMFKGIGKGISGTLRGIGRGLSSLGRGAMTAAPGIATFGVSAMTAVPIILALAAAAVGVGYGIKLAAEGFATMFSTVSMDNILPILLLGPALLGIGAGLGLIAIAGTAAIPALLALTALGAVGGVLGSMFGGDEGETSSTSSSSKNNEMAEVNANLKKLISVVEQGGVVMLDSNRVGEFLPKMLALNEFKIG